MQECCPECYSTIFSRERRINGNDTCQNGHTYPSKCSIRLDKSDIDFLKEIKKIINNYENNSVETGLFTKKMISIVKFLMKVT